MRKPKNDWNAIVTAYKTSGQSQTQWCRTNKVNLNNLRYWLQKEKKATPLAETNCQWVTLDIRAPKPTGCTQQLTLHIGQVCIEVNPGFDPQLLSDIIRTIIAVC